MKLKIKESMKGQIITRNFVGRGKVVIDTSKEFNQNQLKNMYGSGFSDILEYVQDEPIKITEEKSEVKPKNGNEKTKQKTNRTK